MVVVLLFVLSLLSDACDDISVLRVILFLKTLINYVLIFVPAGAILMLSIDMVKNVVSSDVSVQRKNLMLFIRRCIYLLIIFMIPNFVNSVTSFLEVDGNNEYKDYLKCANVTSEKIKYLEQASKTSCIDDYEWDELNNICIFVGDKQELPDNYGIVQRRNKLNVPSVNSLNRTFSGSRSKTMMEYGQGDSRWGNSPFCQAGRSTMAEAGCGATALAMIVTGYGNDVNATPKTVRDYICGNGLHTTGGLGNPAYAPFMQHYGLDASFIFGDDVHYFGSSSYDEGKAKSIKNAVDLKYGVIILIPGHYVVVDKGGCSSDKVYFYNPADLGKNGCKTMNEVWNETWNWHNRCVSNSDKSQYCGWTRAWKFKPAKTTN